MRLGQEIHQAITLYDQSLGTMVPGWQRSIKPWAELPKAENVMLTRLLFIAFAITLAVPAFAQDQATRQDAAHRCDRRKA
jgi:hypothetical protein